ncbi:MAG: NADH-quinone oxidoreductase subunit N, partial [Alphaproteobacteria bacterium]|nr:NADH-quinone oxidoreductase subunit N [Alphaproteobacteria bacterium]
LAALRQTNIKRLLAYSSIGHVGFILMGLAAGNSNGVAAVLIYLLIYLFMSAGAFGCVLLMRRDGVYVENVADLAGLSRTRPWSAFVMALCMFSLAGIPPLAGFFAKLYVVLAAVEGGLTPLAVLGMVTSVIACYYYLRVIKFMYFDEPAAPFDGPVPLTLRFGLGVAAAVTVLFFLAPAAVLVPAKAAAAILLR